MNGSFVLRAVTSDESRSWRFIRTVGFSKTVARLMGPSLDLEEVMCVGFVGSVGLHIVQMCCCVVDF